LVMYWKRYVFGQWSEMDSVIDRGKKVLFYTLRSKQALYFWVITSRNLEIVTFMVRSWYQNGAWFTWVYGLPAEELCVMNLYKLEDQIATYRLSHSADHTGCMAWGQCLRNEELKVCEKWTRKRRMMKKHFSSKRILGKTKWKGRKTKGREKWTWNGLKKLCRVRS
jgi:hypothetical protein